ncbi:pancreatic triacylglycerol lipase-like [Thrips palmi]|uniref:Pancreatic triacylglycerol lipase-like n=1 Tax=Thrips palmi TaxID=161013 RepID=A0A6P9AHV7_THRPL|nr:pancreatic triacylglycerol lipase-like [Thrips palmi]
MACLRAVAVLGLLAVLGGALAISKAARKYSTDVNFVLYLPKGGNVTVKEQDAASLVSNPGFDKNLVTVFYMHGYTETPSSESIAVVSDAFLKRGGYNFILVDWSSFNTFPYIRAIYNLYQLPKPVANTIEAMVKAGLSEKMVWFVTHSMGSQLGGAVARELDFAVPRITALDPAWPGFNFPDIPSLNSGDAEFVDVIHTDAGFYGFATSVGHIDFWPNRGKRVQPSCPSILKEFDKRYCSHHMSWRFFAESLLSEEAFPAKACGSWKDFAQDACSKDAAVAYMGLLADKNKSLSGNFYLTTNSKQPYGKQMTGLHATGEKLQDVVPEVLMVTDWDMVDMKHAQ